jgi:Phosphodiester glycosidase
LWELADLLVDLGAQSAMNLDGGSAGVVIADGRRRNTPRTDDGEDMSASSPSVTGIVLEPNRERELPCSDEPAPTADRRRPHVSLYCFSLSLPALSTEGHASCRSRRSRSSSLFLRVAAPMAAISTSASWATARRSSASSWICFMSRS